MNDSEINSLPFFLFIIQLFMFIIFNNMELRKFIATTIREYLNEQQKLGEKNKTKRLISTKLNTKR